MGRNNSLLKTQNDGIRPPQHNTKREGVLPTEKYSPQEQEQRW